MTGQPLSNQFHSCRILRKQIESNWVAWPQKTDSNQENQEKRKHLKRADSIIDRVRYKKKSSVHTSSIRNQKHMECNWGIWQDDI